MLISPEVRATTLPLASTATKNGNPETPNAALASLDAESTSVRTPQPSSASHADGGKFGRASLAAVLTAKRSTPAGTVAVRRCATISGTSRWQCGHQCATNMTSLGRPSRVMASGVPSKPAPCTSGMGSPTAGSAPLPSAGSGAPVICTGRVCATPGCDGDDESRDAKTAISAAPITTVTRPTHNHVERL